MILKGGMLETDDAATFSSASGVMVNGSGGSSAFGASGTYLGHED